MEKDELIILHLTKFTLFSLLMMILFCAKHQVRQTKTHQLFKLILTLIMFVVTFKIKAMCGLIKLILDVKMHLKQIPVEG